MIVADTDVLIDALEGRPAAVAVVEDLLRSRRLATTAITRLELGVGTRTDRERARVGTLLAAVPVLALDSEAAGLAAEVGSTLRSGGGLIPTADLAIAGICLSLDVPLLTRNLGHFQRIEGLRLMDPPAAP